MNSINPNPNPNPNLNSLMGCHCGIPNPLRKPYRSTTEVKGAKGSSKRWLANAPSKTLEQQYEEKWSTTLRVECNSELAPTEVTFFSRKSTNVLTSQ